MPIAVRSRRPRTVGTTVRPKKMSGGGCGGDTADYGTFSPTTGSNTFMYGLPSSDIGGATVPSPNCTINAASQVATAISPVIPSYAVVDFGQGGSDPISPASAPFMGGGTNKKKKKKGTKKAAGGKKKKKRAAAGGKKKKTTGKKTTSTAAKSSEWMLTEFKVKITNSEGKKVVKSLFYNVSTGEYRLRKMIKKGRKKVARFAPIPKMAEFVR